MGDVGEPNGTQAAVADAILMEHRKEPLDALLVLGDIVYPKGDPAELESKFWSRFRPIVDAGVRLLPALGNHDLQTDREAFIRELGMPGRYYEHNFDEVQLLALDTSTATVDEQQAGWLAERLSAPGPKVRIPFMHVSPYSAGMHGDHQQLKEVLPSLFETHGVRLSLAAHDHNYERTKPIMGTVYLISGGGCCPRVIEPGPMTEASSSEAHYVLIEIHSGRVSGWATTPDGRVIDRFEVAVRELAPIGP